MDKINQTENDILNMKNSRFSDEDRARIAAENADKRERRPVAKAENTNNTKRKNASKKKEKQAKTQISRNEKIKNSTAQRKKDVKRQNNLIAVMLFVVLIAMLGLLSVFLFKINTINIQNDSDMYSNKMIMQTANIDVGDSMLLVNAKLMSEKLVKDLPYIETATIVRKWPDTLNIEISYAKPALAVDNSDGYIILSENCKVLETKASLIKGRAALLKGVKVVAPVEGETVNFEGNIDTQGLIALIQEFKNSGFENISCYDLSTITNVRVQIDRKVDVKLGTLASAADKLQFGKESIVRTSAEDYEHPMIVDLSVAGKSFIRPKYENHISYEEATTIEEDYSNTEEETTDNEALTVEESTSSTVSVYG